MQIADGSETYYNLVGNNTAPAFNESTAGEECYGGGSREHRTNYYPANTSRPWFLMLEMLKTRLRFITKRLLQS